MMLQYQIKVLRDVKNKVLNRRELILWIHHANAKTPTRSEVRDIVSSMFSVPPNLIAVKSIRTSTGTNATEAHVHIYRDEKTLQEVEPQHIKIRNFGKREEKREREEEREVSGG
jgi:ribosomal protein S24E